MRLNVKLMILGLAVNLACGAAHAAPEPSVAHTSWELEFTYSDPQRITLTLPGDDHASTYWYIVYTATNTTGDEAEFYPTFDIVTGDLKRIEAGFGVSPSVNDAILTRHKKAYPFSVDPMKMYGPLLRGEDNARTSIIVFPEFEDDVNAFTVYVGGLSGEVAKIRNPRFDRAVQPSDENPMFFFVRKTLAIGYDVPGDTRTRLEAAPVRTTQAWVMR